MSSTLILEAAASGSSSSMLILIIGMFAVFYFLIIRPENKKKKEAEAMRDSLSNGDIVTTIGGIIGKVVQVTADTITIETSEDRVRVQLKKWAVQTTDKIEAAQAAQASSSGGGLMSLFGKKTQQAAEPNQEAPAPESGESTEAKEE